MFEMISDESIQLLNLLPFLFRRREEAQKLLKDALGTLEG